MTFLLAKSKAENFSVKTEEPKIERGKEEATLV